MRLKKPIVAVSTLGLLALAACGGGTSDEGTGGGSTEAASSDSSTSGSGESSGQPSESASTSGEPQFGQGSRPGTNPNLKPPAEPVPGAKKGGTITVLHSGGGINTSDPTETYWLNALSIYSGLVIRSLTQYKYDPETGKVTLVPDLAKGLGKPNDDFTEWTFTLRKGIKYANGKPVTPEDIKYAIMRCFDRKTFPSGAQYCNNYFLNGKKYDGPYQDGTNYKGVEIHGQKITIKMERPFPDMPYWAAFPAMSPIPPGKASDPATYKNHPWATGPYQFKKYIPQHKLVLVRNPNWDPNTDPVRHQYVDKWIFKLDMDSSKIDQILLEDSGDGQTSATMDNVLQADYAKFKQQAPDRLMQGTLPCTFNWYPDMRKIKNVNVRRALGWAFPYKDAAVAAGNILGLNRKVTDQVMPPGVPGRVDYAPLKGHEAGQTDPAKAKALLKKEGKLGFKIKWAYQTDQPESVHAKDVIKSALEKAGFNPQPVATTSKQYETKYLSNPKADINVRSVGWCSDWPTGSSWMPPLFQTTDVKSGIFGANYEAFSKDSVDKRIKEIQKLPLKKQPKAWMDLEKKIMTKWYPIIPRTNGRSTMMRGSKVHNWDVSPKWGSPTYKRVWIG